MKTAIKLLVIIVITTTLLMSCGASKKFGCPSQVSNPTLHFQTIA
jgi:hypothetical protein